MDKILQVRNIEDVYPMSDIQKGMVYHGLKDKDSGVYHFQMLYKLRIREPDMGTLKRAVQLMVAKHSILRTGFNMDGYKEPVQVVYKHIQFEPEPYDISYMEPVDQKRFLVELMNGDKRRHFDISGGKPLWRIKILRLDKENIYFVWICHHAIMDGWSNAVLMTEIKNTYLELQQNPGFQPRELKGSYKNFIIEEMRVKKQRETSDFWRNELDQYRRLVFPNEFIKGRRLHRLGVHRQDLGTALLNKVRGAAREYNTSVKNLCFAAYVYMLSMISRESDILVGLIVNNRPLCEDGEKIVGCFLNSVPVRIKIPGNISWKDFIGMVDKKMLELLTYGRLSLFEITRVIGEKTSDQNTLFNTIFNFTDFYAYNGLDSEGISVDEADDDPNRGLIDERLITNTLFDFNIDCTGDRFFLDLKYSNALIDDDLALRLCDYFAIVLNKFTSAADEMASKKELLSADERRNILYEFNKTEAEYPHDKTIHQLFAEQVDKTPDGVSIVGSRQLAVGKKERSEEPIQLTYKELNRKSDQLACLLRKKGVQPDTVVGIMIERSIEMIIGIYGIIKAGGAYLPIDPDYPQERIDFMLEDSNARVLVSELSGVSGVSGGIDVVKPGELSEGPPTHLFYVIYTSGSTGKPKGAMVKIQGFVNLLHWYVTEFDIDSNDCVLLIAPISFDLAQKNLYASLIRGGILCLAPPGLPDYHELSELIAREQVTIINSAPSVFYPLVEINTSDGFLKLKSLRYVFLGGESINGDKLAPWLHSEAGCCELVNTYGPTECTDVVSFYRVSKKDIRQQRNIPIGKPIYNVKIFILNDCRQVLPVGVMGELCIGGIGLGKGYHKNPELTAEKFIKTPHLPEKEVYRTGDLARWLADGNLEFIGRVDHQVKIRGFRVEVGEIETRLLTYEPIKYAVVLAKEEEKGDRYLIAYYEADSQLPGQELREYLLKQLPEYMVPVYFVWLDKMPLTPNGKLDRRGLPDPEFETGEKYIAPGDEVERKLTAIWGDVLGIAGEKISIDANFFRLGGHSIKATILVSKIHKTLDVKIPLDDLFKTPTVRGLAKYIKGLAKKRFEAIEPVEEKDYYVLSSAQKRLYILHQMDRANLRYNMPLVLMMEGPLDKGRLQGTFRKLLKTHEILRTSIILVENEPVQRVHPGTGVDFNVEYYEAGEEGTREIVKAFIRPFDLDRAPLLRAGLIKIHSFKYVCMIDMYHIVSDGVSSNLLVKDFLWLYNGKEFPRLRVQYKDFARWQNRLLESGEIKKQEEYWLNRFKGDIPVLDLPMDYPDVSQHRLEQGGMLNWKKPIR
jgi:tyrocidine synthetase-3